MPEPLTRCCNLDWLEVYCLEPKGQPRTPSYFRDLGYEVNQRAYGSPQYREMFTILEDKFPVLEIRRDPYSLRAHGGIFPPNACHIRLSNRTCYFLEPISFLRRFLLAHGYIYQSISRIDIALDFNSFDDGTDPDQFIKRYMRGELAKINQCNLAAHGKDKWSDRVWNSLKWGAPTSIVSTKLYNKTLELDEVHDKFYIRDAWREAGLDCNRDVWRIEFSINSQGQTLQNRSSGEYVKKDLSAYDTRERLLWNWEILAAKYFHFKTVVPGQRKDRCPDYPTIRIMNPWAEIYKPSRNPTKDKEPTRTAYLVAKKLKEIASDVTLERHYRESAQELAALIIMRSRMSLKIPRLDREDLQLTREKSSDLISRQADRAREREIALLRQLYAKYGTTGLVDCPF